MLPHKHYHAACIPPDDWRSCWKKLFGLETPEKEVHDLSMLSVTSGAYILTAAPFWVPLPISPLS